MKVTVKMKPQAVAALTQAHIMALGMVAEQMRHEIITEAVIPFDVGTLQNVGTFVDMAELKQGRIAIRHDTPYAQRLYYNPDYDFQTTTNVNARGLWWDEWLNGSKKYRAQELYKTFFRRVSGGFVK